MTPQEWYAAVIKKWNDERGSTPKELHESLKYRDRRPNSGSLTDPETQRALEYGYEY